VSALPVQTKTRPFSSLASWWASMSSAFHCQLLVIQPELEFQRTIGNVSSAAEQVNYFIQHRIEVHHCPSTCTSAASAWGSQKGMSMARYRAMAADSSGRAWAPLSILR